MMAFFLIFIEDNNSLARNQVIIALLNVRKRAT